jgi:hypothetical protein
MEGAACGFSLLAAGMNDKIDMIGANGKGVAEYSVFREDVITEILGGEPALAIALTTTSCASPVPVIDMVRWLRSASPRASIIVTGPLVSGLIRDLDGPTLRYAMNMMGADVYIRDEDRASAVSAVLDCLRGGGRLSGVPNLYLPVNGAYRYTGQQAQDYPAGRTASWRVLEILRRARAPLTMVRS